MVKLQKNSNNKEYILKAVFEDQVKEIKNIDLIKKKYFITEDNNNKISYFYLDKRNEFVLKKLKLAIREILKSVRDLQIDLSTFVINDIKEEDFVKSFVEEEVLKSFKLFNLKQNIKEKKDEVINFYLINFSDEAIVEKSFDEALIFAHGQTYARNFQIMPPNLLNSEIFADMVLKDFEKEKNIKVQVLNKKQILDLKMGLFLSVNKGSAYEPRMVIFEYTGNKDDKNKTAIIGKGITFDSGGYNIKIGSNQVGMKFDMSGAAIVAGLFKVIAKLKPKSNVIGILMLTDNMISNVASTSDAVFVALNGKSVEINNTDAEGRLVLADGLTYAAKNLNANKLIDIATLTGAVISALGNTYSGVWTTKDEDWNKMKISASEANELIWRMPLHEDFEKNIKNSKVADIKNADLSGKGGSSSAAMFLTNFIEGKDYIHIDIAGTAEINDDPKSPLIKTIFNFLNK